MFTIEEWREQMITAEQFLRRSLWAPLVVPLLAFVVVITNPAENNVLLGNSWQSIVEIVLGLSFVFGIVPYAWMMRVEENNLRRVAGKQLEKTIWQLPATMLPYFWKVMGSLIVMSLITIVGAGLGLYLMVCMAIGTAAVPIIGYCYVLVTFGFLRFFQAVGLIAR